MTAIISRLGVIQPVPRLYRLNPAVLASKYQQCGDGFFSAIGFSGGEIVYDNGLYWDAGSADHFTAPTEGVYSISLRMAMNPQSVPSSGYMHVFVELSADSSQPLSWYRSATDIANNSGKIDFSAAGSVFMVAGDYLALVVDNATDVTIDTYPILGIALEA